MKVNLGLRSLRKPRMKHHVKTIVIKVRINKESKEKKGISLQTFSLLTEVSPI